jgi:hypothetical protein
MGSGAGQAQVLAGLFYSQGEEGVQRRARGKEGFLPFISGCLRSDLDLDNSAGG